MSYGIVVKDANGKDIFSFGRKYFKYVGSYTFPAASSNDSNAIQTATYTLTGIPPGETPFVSVAAIQNKAFIQRNGNTVTAKFVLKRSGGIWSREAVTIIYGYYA